MLQVAPSTYYAAKTRQPCARDQRDAAVAPQLQTLWEENYRVYGARKLWRAAQRAGLDVGRDRVARLMRALGIEGARRTKRVRTTRADPAAARHPDLVGRDFTAVAPNRLWVTDLTYVPTWAGVAYVSFIVDACSRPDDFDGPTLPSGPVVSTRKASVPCARCPACGTSSSSTMSGSIALR